MRSTIDVARFRKKGQKIPPLAPYRKEYETTDAETLRAWREAWLEDDGIRWQWRHPHGFNRAARRAFERRSR